MKSVRFPCRYRHVRQEGAVYSGKVKLWMNQILKMMIKFYGRSTEYSYQRRNVSSIQGRHGMLKSYTTHMRVTGP